MLGAIAVSFSEVVGAAVVGAAVGAPVVVPRLVTQELHLWSAVSLSGDNLYERDCCGAMK